MKIIIAPHRYSIEILAHFRCGSCNRWWSIGDFKPAKNEVMHCPQCGAEREIEEIKDNDC